MAEQRIQKVLADQGICSRREAERLIAAGKVKVNGHPVTLGDKMDPDYDKVMIDGQTQRIVRKRQYTYIMLHKPRGYLTTVAARPSWILFPMCPPCCARWAAWTRTARGCCS